MGRRRATALLLVSGLAAVVLIVACKVEPEATGGDPPSIREETAAGSGSPAATPRPRVATPTPTVTLTIAATGGAGVALRDSCADGARTVAAWPEGQRVVLLQSGRGECSDWSLVQADGAESWVRNVYLADTDSEPQEAPTPTATPAPTTRPSTPVPTPDRSGCHPSYPTVCIPIGAADYDCAGGSGNGPNYIRGPFQVLPPDPHRLDRDGDGVGCE